MELYGTLSAPMSMTRAVPWNSMEFHGTSSAPISLTRAVPWNFMELGMRQFRWHEQFHGIPDSIFFVKIWSIRVAVFSVTRVGLVIKRNTLQAYIVSNIAEVGLWTSYLKKSIFKSPMQYNILCSLQTVFNISEIERNSDILNTVCKEHKILHCIGDLNIDSLNMMFISPLWFT